MNNMITERHPLDTIVVRSIKFQKSQSLPFNKRATVLTFGQRKNLWHLCNSDYFEDVLITMSHVFNKTLG